MAVKVDLQIDESPIVDVQLGNAPIVDVGVCHGAGLSKIHHDDTLVGTGEESDPLAVNPEILDAKVDKHQGVDNAGKILVVGEDGNVTLDTSIGEIEASDVGYTNEQYPDMQNLQDAMDKLLYTAPSVSISGGGSYEIGYTKETTNLSWNWSKKITSQSLNQGIGSLDPTVRSYTYDKPISSNTTFTITGSDGTTTKSASTTLSFMPKRYWGVSTATSLTDAQILALSSELSTSRAQTRTFNCSGGKYFYFVIRTDYCSGIKFKVGGLAFSDMKVETRNVVNAQGYPQSYNIYRVNNIQNGSAIAVEVL